MHEFSSVELVKIEIAVPDARGKKQNKKTLKCLQPPFYQIVQAHDLCHFQ